MSLNDREKRIRQKLKNDFVHYAPRCLRIRTKEGRVAPLSLNKAQLYIHERLEAQRKEKGYVRALLLKGRQQGASTYTEARFYWKVTHRKGVRAFILTHLDDATQNLFGMAKRFHENCPERVKPTTRASNAKEIIFDRLDSSYKVSTAGSKGAGRSETLQYFHGSEVAYWPNADSHVAGVLQAVPLLPDTEIILESTSAGAQGRFYEMCMEAHRGHGDYQLVFVPWYWQDEYRKPVPEGFKPTADELSLKREFGLDDAQLVWRRDKIIEFGGNVSQFRREYPFTVAEAFQTEVPGALWTRETIAKNRKARDGLPAMKRIVVAIDPAATSKESSDETGIIVAGLGEDDHGYVLADLSGRYKPAQWAAKAVAAYHDYGADRIVGEVNNGGEMVEHTVRTHDGGVAFKAVHASRGKRARAEPIAALTEQGRVHHVGIFEKLEDQLTSWDATGDQRSPDRLDAMVWSLTELMLVRASGEPRIWGV